MTVSSAVRDELTNAYLPSGRKITIATPSVVGMRRVSRMARGSITDT
jgi:hypothetical protein